MANDPPAHSVRRAQAQQRQLQSLESRLENLEGDLGSLLTGGSLREPPSRAARVSRSLIVGGVLLILVAIVLAIV